MTNLAGIYPALVTPYTKDGRINESSLQKLVKLNQAKGVAGFYIGGSTGEAFMLSLAERKRLLEVVAEAAEGKSNLIFHVGCIATEHAIELAKHAAQVGVQAISAVPPFYYKFAFTEIRDYYFDIIRASGQPMIVYNIPALSGVTLSSDNVAELLQEPLIIGVKHTTMDLYQLERMRRFGSRLILFNGYDEVFLAGLAMGADGAIGSTFNFMAEKFLAIRKLFQENRLPEAQKIQEEANRVIDVLVQVGVFPGIKYVMGLLGIECGECRKPFRALTEADKELLRKITEENHYFGIAESK